MIRMPDIPVLNQIIVLLPSLERIGRSYDIPESVSASYISVSDKSRSGSYLGGGQIRMPTHNHARYKYHLMSRSCNYDRNYHKPFPDSVYQTSSFTEIPAHANQGFRFH